MSRGFLMGAGWGILVAGVGLVVASQVTDMALVVIETAPPAVVASNAPSVATGAISPANSDAPAAESVSEAAPKTADPDVVPNLPDAEPEAPKPAEPRPEAQTAIPAPTAPAETGTAPRLPQSGAKAPAFAAAVSGVAPLPETRATDAPPAADTAPAELPPVVASAPDLPLPDLPLPDLPLPDLPLVVPPAAEATAPEPSPSLQTAPALRPSPGFAGKAVDGVETGRLPAIEGAAAAPAEKAAEGLLIDDPDVAPINQFAAAFDNPNHKPLFAILLQDTGGPDLDREALAALPFPVSFVIDPTQPDAATAARIYRAQGKEVLMLATGIPAGATASDIAVSLEVNAKVLAEAVGIVDLETGGFQGNRALATQVLALVRDQGRGVLTWDRGLNAASQVAQREGMRHAVIFRNLDNEGEGTPLIRRYLDRAAFKAAQDGRVVVAGKTRPETVAALLEWAVEGRAETVALAPSTAVMTAP